MHPASSGSNYRKKNAGGDHLLLLIPYPPLFPSEPYDGDPGHNIGIDVNTSVNAGADMMEGTHTACTGTEIETNRADTPIATDADTKIVNNAIKLPSNYRSS